MKARLLEGCLLADDSVVEFGTYVGYSALVLARRLRHLGGGGRVISCEIDAALAFVARAVIAWAGATGEVEVRIGCAADWIATGRLGPIDMLVLDHRGTRYHEDLRRVEASLSCGARVFADNVLHPGAPLFLGYIDGRYDVDVYEVREFAHEPPVDDWVVVCMQCDTRFLGPWLTLPELRFWSAEVDMICQESLRRPVDWVAFQRRVRPALVHLMPWLSKRMCRGSGPPTTSHRL